MSGATLEGMKEAMTMVAVVDGTCGHPECKDQGTYTMPAKCWNCGKEYALRLTRGHETPTLGQTCPNCGCNRVKAKW